MNKILVTGGTGYIGSHTVVELINAGFEVVIIDNLSNSSIYVLDGIKNITGIKPEFHKIDLTDKHKTNEFFNYVKNIDAIIHFAAYKAVGESVKKPLMYYENNIGSLINILKNVKEHKIKGFVFSSSCTVYGQAKVLPVTEKTPIIKADSPYGNTKQIAEDIISDFISSETNSKAISLRYFNPIGAHDSAEIGELPLGVPNNLIPFITQTAVGIRKQISVFGNDYNTPDGTAIRDYIHVVDLAKAHIVALKRMLENDNKKRYEVFNIGTGQGNSVMDIINTFEEVNKLKLNYKIAPRRAGDIEKVWADTSYANKELGWKTEKTLSDSLKSAWEWEKRIRNEK